MAAHMKFLSRGGLIAIAFLALCSAAQAQPVLTIEPKVVVQAETVAATITSNGALDLSRITRDKISFTPPGNVPVSTIKVGSATSRTLNLSFQMSIRPQRGPQLINIDFGDMIISLKMTAELARPKCGPANCRAPNKCVQNICTPPQQTTCQPACTPPRQCNQALRRCELPQ